MTRGELLFPPVGAVTQQAETPDDLAEQRWQGYFHPVPALPIPSARPGEVRPTPIGLLAKLLFGSDLFGLVSWLIVGVGVCALLATRGVSQTGRYDLALTGVLLAQVGAAVGLAGPMMPRLLAPLAVTMALLGGGVLARLSRVEANPLPIGRRDVAQGWGLLPAILLGVSACGINLFVSWQSAAYLVRRSDSVAALPAEQVARNTRCFALAGALPAESQLLVIGDGRAWYYPPGMRYTTPMHTELHDLAWIDRNPDITHVMVVRDGLAWRVRAFGLAESYSRELFDCSPGELIARLESSQVMTTALDRRDDFLRAEVIQHTPRTIPTTRPARLGNLLLYVRRPAGAKPGWTPEPIVLP